MIPALESAPDSDFGSFQTTNRCDSGSSSFSLESLESAPKLLPIPTTKIDWNSAFLVSRICKKIQNMMDYVWKYTTILTLEQIPSMEPIPAWNRLRLRLFFQQNRWLRFRLKNGITAALFCIPTRTKNQLYKNPNIVQLVPFCTSCPSPSLLNSIWRH